jgi:hypothetical protein
MASSTRTPLFERQTSREGFRYDEDFLMPSSPGRRGASGNTASPQ